MFSGTALKVLKAKADGNILEGALYSNLFKNYKVVEMRTNLRGHLTKGFCGSKVVSRSK